MAAQCGHVFMGTMETIIDRGTRLLVRLLLGIAIGTVLHDLAEATPQQLALQPPPIKASLLTPQRQ